jgi:nicotinamidase-related amidase
MTDRPWDRFLTSSDREVISAAGYGAKGGLGERPVLLVVDMTYNFCGDRAEPILASIKRWRASCGEAAWDAVPQIEALIAVARQRGVPVIYTLRDARDDGWDRGRWRGKNRRSSEDAGRDGNRIVAELAPQPGDIVLRKQKPSAFFATPLIAQLTQLRCDTVIVAGCTTSGCVRATVLDAFSYNLRVAVPQDAVFDRAEASHAISLFDMNAKYADVLPAAEIAAWLRAVPQGMFDLPD